MDNYQKQILDVVRYSRSIGVAHIPTVKNNFDGLNIDDIEGPKVSFSLCDYLGLATDQRIKEAAAKAIMDFGSCITVSRTYVKFKPLLEAEEMMSELMGRPTLVVPKTSLGHLSILPVIISKDDMVILDHQVHTTVRIAIDSTKANGATIKTIRHNDMEKLEQIIRLSKDKYRKIWYLGDGVYSMYGDVFNHEMIETFLNRYDNFYAYIDDSHGMSWTGINGTGYALSKMKLHPKMYLSASLGKGFGSGGGCLVCPDKETRDEIEILGAPIMFSSPIAPGTLGAISASYKIHTSNDIVTYQNQQQERVDLVKKLADEYHLPIVHGNETPIVYIASGQPDMTSQICQQMLKGGFHITGGVFPAVPYNSSGIRLLISRQQTLDNINDMMALLRDTYYKAVEERDIDISKLIRHYKNVHFKQK